MSSKESSASAQYALARGQSALATKNSERAISWLDRANRLAPTDNSIKLLLASALGSSDLKRSRAILEELTTAHAQAWTAKRILWTLHSPDDRASIDLLANMLSHSALSEADVPFFPSWHHAATIFGAPGWIGFYPDGRLRLSTPGNVRLDGRRISSRRNDDVGGFVVRLADNWRLARSLTVEKRGRHFLGSPINIQAQTEVEGFVELSPDGDLVGWAWMPAAPDVAAKLMVVAENQPSTPIVVSADDDTYIPTAGNGVDRPRAFRIPAEQIAHTAPIHVYSLRRQELFGSPIRVMEQRCADKRAAQRLATAIAVSLRPNRDAAEDAVDRWRPLPAHRARWSRMKRALPIRAGIDVVIPVFKGCADFLACLESVRASIGSAVRIVVVDDCSRDHDLLVAVKTASETGVIVLSHDRNLGFPSAANTGFRHAANAAGGPRDVVLLNPDTLVPRGWLERLCLTAYSDADIGTVTPFTNDGSIVSYPNQGEPAPLVDQLETDRLSALMAAANSGLVIDLPTGIGFCMYVRHDCLGQTGLFREDAFAQGYGEENDFCLRAYHLGWRHVADPSVFVAHAGGRSFGAVKVDLIRRNTATLNQLHPGYEEMIEDFLQEGGLRHARANIDKAIWKKGRCAAGSVILVTHASGGGVARHVRDRAQNIRALGLRPIILRPVATKSGDKKQSYYCSIDDDTSTSFPNITFEPDTAIADLVLFLREETPRLIEFHHLLGHSPRLMDLPSALALSYDVVLHDFALVCPRITLCGGSRSYCGEPLEVETCEICVADNGNRLNEDISAAALRARSRVFLSNARQVIAPTMDAAQRVSRYVPLPNAVIRGWEDDSMILQGFERRKSGKTPENIKVAIIGAIGEEKGFNVLLSCARDVVKRRLGMSFVVVGHTIDDERLIDTGAVFITGEYEESEIDALIAAQHASLGFLPSVCPETWSYALSSLWRARLWPVTFDLGGHAERIRRSGCGSLLPLGLPASRINDFLRNSAVTAQQ